MKKIKSPRVPVTQGLKNLYAMDMHMAYHAALMGQLNVTLFSRLAAAISVVRTALVSKQSQFVDAVELLDAAILVLVEVRRRGDAQDVWQIDESERDAVLQGINMAEQCIGTLDVALLEQTAQRLLREMAV